MRFPALATMPLPFESEPLVEELSRTLLDPRWAEGYLRLRGAAGDDHFLFVHQGKAHFAGAVEDDRFVSCSFLDFFEALSLARAAEYSATDQPLLLSVAVPFRKAPSAQLAAGTVTRESLLAAIEASMHQSGGRDAVLAFRRGDAVSLALVRGNSPGWLYPSAGERFPDTGTPAERIVGYVSAFTDVAADVYDEVVLPASEGAGRPLREYLDESMKRSLIPVGLVPSLAVYMGTRVVYRYVMSGEQIRVGRGGDNDLALDNLTVSRSHATVKRQGDGLLLTDLGSENGILQNGKRVKEVLLKAGDRVELGKYSLVYDHYAPKSLAAKNPAADSRRKAVEETLGVSGPAFRTATFRHDGKSVRMSGMVFHIGKAEDAHLRIAGMFVAPIHVRVIRDSNGTFRASHAAGARAMSVNGKAETEVVLKHGDEIEIAGSIVHFELDAPAKLGPR